jgi:hypothetical protein
MKSFYILFYTLIIVFCSVTLIPKISTKINLKKSDGKVTKTLSKLQRIEKAFELEFKKTLDPNLGIVPRERLIQAQLYADRISQFSSRAAISGINWEERGPNNVGGRTRALIYDANDATGKTVFAGSVSGGIWKTTDITAATPVWTPINDLQELAVSTIVQSPINTNIMYFGSGEGWSNIDAVRGTGIYKSTNGGATWAQLSSTNNSNFYYNQKLVIKDVSGTEYLFAATRSGLRRSTDGGTTWTKVLGSGLTATSDRIADIELAANGDLYASAGIFQTDGIYKSTDNGTNWTKLSGGGLPASGYERIELACAPSNSARIYALFQHSTNNTCSGIYRSSDSGASWTSLTVPTVTGGVNLASSQAWYDLIAAVDPNNQDRIIVGGLDLAASTNGGTNWTQISSWYGAGGIQNVHADNHAIVFKPGSSSEALFGNDGGIYRSINANNTSPTFTSKNNSYNVTQFYACAINSTPGSNNYLAGAQDNGSHKYSVAGINTTTSVTGGDGAFTHIDEDQPNIQITSYIYDDYFISTNSMASYTEVEIDAAQDQGLFINPTDYDSKNNTLYGADSINRYHFVTNVGTTNTKGVRTLPFGTRQITTIAVSPNTDFRFFCGLETGQIVRIDNAISASPTMTNISTGLPSGAYFSSIAVEKGNDNHILVASSSYGINSVWETINGGSSWTSVEGNLPDMPIRWIIFAPDNNDQAIVATEIGAWSTDNLNGTSTVWGETNSGLARVRTDMLKVRSCENTIIAATHGRGLYSTSYFEKPIVYFSSNQTNVTESTSATTGCKGYTDVNVPIVISKTASAAANINVTVDVSSTATSAMDYEIITPMPISLLTGGTSQNITVRIYDDGVAESSENIILDFTITNSGSTNAKKKCEYYLHTINIIDNDYTPESTPATIWSEDFESTANFATPTGWSGFYGQTATNPNVFAIYNSTCNNIINTKTAIVMNRQDNICGYNVNVASAATIYKTVDATNYANINVTFDWKGNGEVDWDYGEMVYATGTSGSPTWVVASSQLSGSTSIQNITVSLPSILNNTQFRLGWRWKNDDNTGSTPAFSIDNIVVKGNKPAVIQTATNPLTNKTINVGPYQTVSFFDSSTGNIMGTIKNNTSTDYGCIKVEVDRAGTTSAQFWNNTSSNYLANKIFKITPQAAIAGPIDYDITLFYTQNEVNGWQTATGQTISNAQIIKVSGNNSIADITPINHSSYTIDALTANVVSYNTSDYKISASNLSSFSGFGLGVLGIPYPVSLLSFNGKLVQDKVKLTWITTNEQQNKGFDIERSVNLNEFYKIGFLEGLGNSNTEKEYNFYDEKQLSNVHYYRLKQIDFDGNYKYSNVVKIRFKKFADIIINPNPFSESLIIQFPEIVDSPIFVKIYDNNGKQVYIKNFESNTKTIVIQDDNIKKMARGTYLLQLSDGYETFNSRIIKL